MVLPGPRAGHYGTDRLSRCRRLLGLDEPVDRRAGGVEGPDRQLEGSLFELGIVRVTRLLEEVSAFEKDVAQTGEVEGFSGFRTAVRGQLKNVHASNVGLADNRMTMELRTFYKASPAISEPRRVP